MKNLIFIINRIYKIYPNLYSMNRNIPIVITWKVIDYLKDWNVKVELSNWQIITVSSDIISEYISKTIHKEYTFKNIGEVSIMNEYL